MAVFPSHSPAVSKVSQDKRLFVRGTDFRNSGTVRMGFGVLREWRITCESGFCVTKYGLVGGYFIGFAGNKATTIPPPYPNDDQELCGDISSDEFADRKLCDVLLSGHQTDRNVYYSYLAFVGGKFADCGSAYLCWISWAIN